MALYRRKLRRKTNYIKIFTACLILGGGLLVLVLLYKALLSSTDTRSKAAAPQVTLKSWEFDKNAEGWTVKNVPISVQNGRLIFPLRLNQSPVLLMHDGTVPVPDRLPGKKIKIRIAAATGDQQVLGTEDDQVVVVTSDDRQAVAVSSSNNTNFLELLRQWVSVYNRRSNLPEARQLPTPTCIPRPACLDANPACQVMPPYNGVWCSASPTPKPTCVPRPACLDANPPCRIQLLPGQVLCPVPKPSGSVVLMELTRTDASDTNLRNVSGIHRIPVDGVMREYEMPLQTARNLTFQFSTQKNNSSAIRVYIDWIKISAIQITPTLSPTPTPYDFTPDYWCDSSPCPSGYRCVSPPYPCPEGNACAFRPYCVKGETASPTPSIPQNCRRAYYCPDNDGPCEERLVCPTVTPVPTHSAAGCRVTGCSGQVCSDQDLATTCEYKPEYACYRTATCTRLNNGKCGWVQTAELQQCILQARGESVSSTGNLQ